MSALNRFEEFLEHMVEGSVARFFRSQIQPSEIARRLERAMESQQQISVSRVIVPNLYRAFLNPQDFALIEGMRGNLEREMANYLVELARERGFSMIEHPTVQLAADSGVPRRAIQVLAETVAINSGTSSHTQVMQAPAVGAAPAHGKPSAYLLLHTPTGPQRVALESSYLRLGRGLDNDIILEDSRVSRYHAQLNYRARRFYVSDVGSTNGTFVNGERVSEQALRDNDQLSLGGLELTFKEG